MTTLTERSKVSRMNNMERETFVAAKAERVEMKLNTDSAVASGLLIQRLTELYENPVEATVRETTSNAIDAVTESYTGKRPEVKIYSPTSLNPVLVIKDNGVGMTYDDLKEIYSKYGASTKTDDLEQVGAYGLGAKSPLAYGTEFTVTSVKDGMKTTIIVAREEMTNYIKIVNSDKTNEPTGTTVSIPVNTSDIHRFTENIDKYRSIPLDKDVDLYIDGSLISADGYKEISDNVLIYDGKEKVYGRVWVDTDRIVDLLTEATEEGVKRGTQYVIGGWAYSSPRKKNTYYSYDGKGIVVELKAGIVGFNSSRDSILDNERFTELEDLIVKYVSSSQFIDDLKDEINNSEISEFKSIVSRLLNHNIEDMKLIDNKIIVESGGARSRYSSFDRHFDLDDFVHEETGFSFNDLLKDIPKTSKPTVIVSERKDYYYKQPRVSVFANKIQRDLFKTKNVSDMNDVIDDVLVTGEAKSDNLEVFMAGLSTFIFNDISRNYRNSNYKNSSLTFITEIKDEKEVRSIKSGRRALVRYRNEDNEKEYNSILIYTEHKKSEMKRMVKNLGDDIDIKIYNVEEALNVIKKARAKSRVAKKKVKKSTSVKFFKYDPETGESESVSLEDIDKKDNNYFIVNKNRYMSQIDKRKIHNWISNENNYADDDFNMYLSLGMHKVNDVETVTSLGKVFRNPRSERAGQSKAYMTKIHKNVAGMNTIKNNSKNLKGEAFVRIVTGITGSSPESISQSIEYYLKAAEKVAKIAKFDFPKLPEDKLKEFSDYESHTFTGMGYYSEWRSGVKEIEHLLSIIDKEQHEAIQSMIYLSRSILVKVNDDNTYDYSHADRVDFGGCHILSKIYSEKNSTPLYESIKKSTEVNLELIKNAVNSIKKANF